MKKRILRVTFNMPYGPEVIREDLDVRVRIMKAALRIQNRATMEIFGLTTQLRESLLSQFTAWKHRQRQVGMEDELMIKVSVEAGYSDQGREQVSRVFVGEVAIVDIISPPPDIGIRIQCYTRQIDRTKTIRNMPPANTTFVKFVEWGANEMGLNFICDTSYNDQVLKNPGRSITVASAILASIQDMYMPDVAAFVDDDILIVKDRDKVIRPDEVANVNSFVGIPSWSEWGVEFQCLFEPSIRVAGGVAVESLMNPSVNGNYVITALEYDLASRDRPFYIKVMGSPAA